MQLVSVRRRNVVHDIANIGSEDTFSIPKFTAEHNAWMLNSAQKNSQSTRSFDDLIHVIFDNLIPYANALVAATKANALEEYKDSCQPLIRSINASLALSRMIRSSNILQFGSSHIEPSGQSETNNPLIYFDIEDDEVLAGTLDAFGVLLKADDLENGNALGCQTKVNFGRSTWYKAENEGLYLSVTHPAEYTQTLLNGLARTMGNSVLAMSALNSRELVTVRPHLSVAYLNTPDLPPMSVN